MICTQPSVDGYIYDTDLNSLYKVRVTIPLLLIEITVS